MRNKHREIAAWAYYDDRSLKSTGGQAALNAAVAETNRFDTAVGLRENFRKRLTWEFSQNVEHLGLSGAPASNRPFA